MFVKPRALCAVPTRGTVKDAHPGNPPDLAGAGRAQVGAGLSASERLPGTVSRTELWPRGHGCLWGLRAEETGPVWQRGAGAPLAAGWERKENSPVCRG